MTDNKLETPIRGTFCGLVQNQMSNTTAHGVPRIESSTNLLRRLYWVVVFLGGVSLFLWQCSTIISKFYDRETTVNIDMKFKPMLSFPAVTICNLNPVKVSALLHDQNLRDVFGYPKSEGESDDGSGESGIKRRKRGGEASQSPDATPPTLQDNSTANPIEAITNKEFTMPYKATTDTGTTADYSRNWESKHVAFNEKREGFKLREKVQNYMASKDYEDRSAYGHSLNDLLFDCLNLELYIEEKEYISDLQESSGVRIVIHDQNEMPFPEDDGFMAAPGFLTSVGLRMIKVTRQPDPYSTCKTDADADATTNIFSELFSTGYTRKACEKSCFSWAVTEHCMCTDIIYKYHSYETVCNSTDPDIVECQEMVSLLNDNGELSCNVTCAQPCEQRLYEATVSNVVWPNEQYKSALTEELFKFSDDVKQKLNDNNNFISENMVKIDIYYNELNYEYIQEQIAYDNGDVVSDLGGQVGLWLGVSVITCCEFIEFMIDVCILLWKKLTKASNLKVTPSKLKETKGFSEEKSGMPKEFQMVNTTAYGYPVTH
uniref:Degenerin mec-10-like n=1 Tax=Saccoglossus kowalevskii TaxID=10224 RepID=A0ABM0M002_SACKO|nr:PREDICTED: degenerin mec-10-like [Saccoglossus kowalevskii]